MSDAPTEPEPRLVVAAAIVRDGLVLVARRRAPEAKWEFPGGKAEPGEEPLAALHRELREELGLTLEIGDEIRAPHGFWPINDRLRMRVWYARGHGVPECRADHDAVAWSAPAELPTFDWLPADIPVAARIAAELIELAP